jgi:type IV pilus assembly protein PilN
MTEINLLPWREQKREWEKRQFTTYFLTGMVFSIGIVGLIFYYATYLVDVQTERNQRLQTEITVLEKQIQEISEIKKLRQALIARMTIVQNLQATRTLTVRLLDETVNIMPDGVYLTKVERVGDKVTILGYAESNSNISKLMRNIEINSWIKDPELTEIKKSTELKKEVHNEFKLNFILKPKTTLGLKS